MAWALDAERAVARSQRESSSSQQPASLNPAASAFFMLSPSSLSRVQADLCYYHRYYGEKAARCNGLCTVQLGRKLAHQGFLNAVSPGHLVHVSDQISNRRFHVNTGVSYYIVPHHSSSSPTSL